MLTCCPYPPPAGFSGRLGVVSSTIDVSHAWYEDGLALVTGSALTAFGLLMLKSAGLVVGGMAGLALNLSYLTQMNVGVLFMLLSLPFFVFGQRTLGWPFTLKSLLVSAFLVIFTLVFPQLVTLDDIHPLFAAAFGGALCGVGILAVIRHHASVGGLGVLIIYLHERRHIPAGVTQFIADGLIVLSALAVIGPRAVAYSVISTAVLSVVLLTNHRPGRYMG